MVPQGVWPGNASNSLEYMAQHGRFARSGVDDDDVLGVPADHLVYARLEVWLDALEH